MEGIVRPSSFNILKFSYIYSFLSVFGNLFFWTTWWVSARQLAEFGEWPSFATARCWLWHDDVVVFVAMDVFLYRVVEMLTSVFSWAILPFKYMLWWLNYSDSNFAYFNLWTWKLFTQRLDEYHPRSKSHLRSTWDLLRMFSQRIP